MDDAPYFKDMFELLELRHVVHRIVRFELLPDLGEPFDLIAAFSVVFDCNTRKKEVWYATEWSSFVDDCLGLLGPGGRLYIAFNPASRCSLDFIPDDVAEMLRSLTGGTPAPNKATFSIYRNV